MKIFKAIRDLYIDSRPRYKKLEEEAKAILGTSAEKRGWLFVGRLKKIESFAQKIETGRVPDPSAMEDFYACTIAVPTIAEIDSAKTLVLQKFDLSHRKPESDDATHKSASSFVFDDLRLYVSRRPSTHGPHTELDGLVFEVQIKTLLQHAWSIATHDLIYKSDSVSWPRERIASQVKAMLEHVEVAIAEASHLEKAPTVAKSNARTDAIRQLISEIKKVWPEDRLPENIKRLAETILDLLRTIGRDANCFTSIIEEERRRLGLLPINLSPYAFFVQALARSSQVDLQRKLARNPGGAKICIHSGMDLPDWMEQPHQRIIHITDVPSGVMDVST